MKYKWLSKRGQQRLIVFFSGWGCDEKPFLQMDKEDYDVVVLFDYKSLHMDEGLIAEINSYSHVDLIAWSFGVWVAGYCCNKYGITPIYKVAINGTGLPVDDRFGIPESIVYGTMDRLNARNLMKFQQRMVGGKEEFESFKNVKPQRGWEDQKEELQSLVNYSKKTANTSFPYDKAYVGMQDLIFTAHNQLNFWHNKLTVVKIDAPHYCFYKFKTWNDFIG